MEDSLQHEKELCGELVPRLFDDDVWEDIDKLNVLDTILVLRQAQDAIHKGLFEDLYDDSFFRKDVFEAATAKLGRVLCKKVMALPSIYTLIDTNTLLPALDQRGGFYLFTERAFADEALDYHLQQMRLWEVKEISQKDIYPFLGNEFYCNGARYAVINDGQDWSMNRPEEFIEKPRNDDAANAPVCNPDYIRALTMLQQELRWRARYDGKEKTLRRYEDEMIRTFAGARFLVPFKSDTPSGGIVTSFEPGSHIMFASVSNGDGRSAMPIFSDWDQFAMAYDLDEWNGWVVKAEELPGLPAETVVLNISTIAFAMSKPSLGQMLSIYRNELAPRSDGNAVDGGKGDGSDADNDVAGKDGTPLSHQDYQGYVIPLKGGTLRERIEEMMALMGEIMGRPADISGLKKLYADEKVPLLPAGERFLKQYAYLFSTMSPSFENEDDNPEFYFDTFDEVREGVADNSLSAAFGRSWRATAIAGCPVTPVGLYGFANPLTVYAGEDGKLYAFKGYNDEVRVYNTLPDLLEAALQGHMPIGLDD